MPTTGWSGSCFLDEPFMCTRYRAARVPPAATGAHVWCESVRNKCGSPIELQHLTPLAWHVFLASSATGSPCAAYSHAQRPRMGAAKSQAPRDLQDPGESVLQKGFAFVCARVHLERSRGELTRPFGPIRSWPRARRQRFAYKISTQGSCLPRRPSASLWTNTSSLSQTAPDFLCSAWKMRRLATTPSWGLGLMSVATPLTSTWPFRITGGKTRRKR
jgi:hypothetical protein